MGFLKKIFNIFIIISFISALSGCARSIIKIMSQNDDQPIAMFAESGERNFYVPIDLSDSLKLLWENDVYGSFNKSSFIFYDSTIFVHDLGGRIHAFNIHSGKQIGVLKYKGSVLSAPVINKYNIIIPLVLNNENKTELIFYDFFNGKELNIIEVEGRIINQLLKIENDIIISTEEGMVRRYNTRGNEIWSVEIGTFIRSNPAYTGGRLFVITIEGELICLDIESSDIIYRKKLSSAVDGGITIKNKKAFFSDVNGVIYSIDTNNGEIIWKFETGFRTGMNPALDNENVLIGNHIGELFSINQLSGHLNWKKNFEGAVFNSSPLITNNKVIISNLFRSVLILNKSNGELTKEMEVQGRVKMTPAIRDNILFIGFDKGVVRAYEIIN
jgi:outer membrane protein assembly factor BamB